MYIWDDECLIRALCEFFNSYEPRICDFLPERLGEVLPTACVSGVSGGGRIREYIDGSALWEFPFEVRIRIDGNSPADILRALSFFESFGEWIEGISPRAFGSIKGAIRTVDGPVKTDAGDGGDAEFRAGYVLRYGRDFSSR